MLAHELADTYRYENCAVVALSDGSVLVAEQIAAALHCVLTMLLIHYIEVPGEDQSFGGITQTGNFTFNGSFSEGQVDDYVSEYHGYLDDQRREAMHDINCLLGDGGVIDTDLLRDRVVIFVADGIDNSAAVDVAMDFIKPIRTKKIIFATPVASVPGVDKLHMAADELHVLDVRENFMGIDHYYEDNTVPEQSIIVEKLNQIVLNWH